MTFDKRETFVYLCLFEMSVKFVLRFWGKLVFAFLFCLKRKHVEILNFSFINILGFIRRLMVIHWSQVLFSTSVQAPGDKTQNIFEAESSWIGPVKIQFQCHL